MSKRKDREERRRRRTLKTEVPETTKAELYAIAAEYGVPLGQVMAVLLEFGYEAIRNGEIDLSKYLKPTGAPQLFDHNIDIDQYIKDLKKKRKK